MSDIGKDLIELGQYLMSHSLAWGNSGNLSVRVDTENFLITATGTDLGKLMYDDFVNVEIASGRWQGKVKPSKEVPMHTAIYSERSDAGAIIHASPFWSTLFACADAKVVSELFVESMYYLEKIAYVEYFHPGSNELGEAVRAKAREANIIILANHGVIVYDSDIREARMRLETLETTCRMIVTANAAELPLKRLSPSLVMDFLHNSGYKLKKK